MLLMRGIAGMLLAAIALASPMGASVASACEAPTPTAATVAAEASYIVSGQIADHAERFGLDHWTLSVDAVIKGSAESVLRIKDARISACGGDLSGLVGWGIIFARGVPFLHAPSLDAYWIFDTDGTLAGASNTHGFTLRVDTIETVTKVLKHALPDTSVAPAASAEPQPAGPLLGFVTLAVGLLLAALLNRRTRRLSS